ncbi:MAG: terminase family protein [Caulobacter sp.]|nr:terminase family protein [Caulobacter sp.]
MACDSDTILKPWKESTGFWTRDWLEWIKTWSENERRSRLTRAELEIAQRSWRTNANPAQREPRPDWSTWLALGGRGSGKTWLGAGWTVEQALDGRRIALVGASFDQIREVMIEGPSGIRALSPDNFRPRYEKARRRIIWPNRALAYCFSAENPDSLRGPQFEVAWADEFCAWPSPGETLAMLRLGLRLGEDPRLLVSTTPRPIAALRALLKEPRMVESRLPTVTNAHNLSPGFLTHLEGLYGGTRLAAQELDGLIVEGEGALWRAEDLARCRGARPPGFDRVVVAVDPPATAGGDACGIVAAGRLGDRAFVLADETVQGLTPRAWALRAVDLAREVGACAIVAEGNQGGDMVRSVLAGADPPCPVRMVHARYSKRARAEPVAALYEQGRVIHCGAFPALEEELMALGCGSRESPDRADALVWALTDLMLGRTGREPRVRVL